MIDLEDIDIDEEGALTATALLPGERHVTVEFAVDDEDLDVEEADDGGDEDGDGGGDEERDQSAPDVDRMRGVIEHALARLTEEVLDAREHEVIAELTAAAYGDDEDSVDQEAVLAADIALDGVLVFADGVIVLLYLAPEQYPGSTIRCQLDDDLDLDDLEVD
ncbi:hypothetical protein J2Y69_000434 [Microbacterium resistens]|uniref:DUF2004 domain-containing protein n=1 Tax=Microbacterium resistens TaxID=156977 RepID=A0ABU1S8C5_9MICO|nr:hypothetical protein [Microbacterium resistens]MDR6865849.1 hypothetical protein [Microbacterium resistens]